MHNFKIGDRVVLCGTDGEHDTRYWRYVGLEGVVINIGNTVAAVTFDGDHGYILPYTRNLRHVHASCPVEVK